MTVGVTDPIAFLDHAGIDWDIAVTIVEEAQALKAQARQAELQAIIEAVGKSVGYRVSERISQLFR